MKTIIYVLLAVFIFSILATSFNFNSNNTHKILLQSADNNISASNLSQSAKIIAYRLEMFSTEKSGISIIADKNQILVTLSKNWDVKTAESLMTQKGMLEFRETGSLNLDNELQTTLSGADLESFKLIVDSASQQNYIQFRFKESAVKQWAEITKRNINKELAIVLDKQVIFAPVLKSEIKDGNCAVTGNFTYAQLKFIETIVNSGELPAHFTIVK